MLSHAALHTKAYDTSKLPVCLVPATKGTYSMLPRLLLCGCPSPQHHDHMSTMRRCSAAALTCHHVPGDGSPLQRPEGHQQLDGGRKDADQGGGQERSAAHKVGEAPAIAVCMQPADVS